MGGRGSYSAIRKRERVRTEGGRSGQRTPHPMDMEQFIGQTLRQIEDRIRSLDHEELFVFDSNGEIVGAYRGDEKSVSFPASFLLKEGAVVTHGHPKGVEGFGATFSPQDVLNFAASEWAEHRAVASGPNELNYIMRRTVKTTLDDSKALYKRVQKDAPGLERQMRNEASKAMRRGELTDVAKRQIYTGVLSRYWKRVLPEYNFEYIARKDPYAY